MSEDKRAKDSQRTVTHLQVNRKLSRTGDESFDIDEYANEYYNYQDRRSSSQSISRFNSCPQLVDVEQQNQTSTKEIYEQTSDDIQTGSSNFTFEERRVFVQRPSPVFSKRELLENGQTSETPTPPSTPKSRRSQLSSRDSLLSSPEKTYVTSPFASPRLLLRKQLMQSALSRDSSIDSLTEKSVGENGKKVPLSVENLNKFDDIKLQEEVPKSPKEENSKLQKRRGSRRGIQPEDNVNKCETWLQSLQIAQTDRIKSRSNIQLPPI